MMFRTQSAPEVSTPTPTRSCALCVKTLICNCCEAPVLCCWVPAARALKLASEKVSQLFLVNRTARKAAEVAAEIRQRFPRQEVVVGYPTNRVDLVINATSLGLKPEDPLPFDPKQFSLRLARAVYDMIYRPAETPLLKAAKAAACRTANGIGMLLHQGAKALEIWSEKTAPTVVMRRALEKSVYG